MNTAHFTGRVGQDPQPLGQNGVRFSLAVDDYNSAKKERETTWVPCVAFGKQAEFISQYVNKGRLVEVTARYATREYEYQGEKRKDHNFVVDRISPLGPGPDRQQQRQQPPQRDEDALW